MNNNKPLSTFPIKHYRNSIDSFASRVAFLDDRIRLVGPLHEAKYSLSNTRRIEINELGGVKRWMWPTKEEVNLYPTLTVEGSV